MQICPFLTWQHGPSDNVSYIKYQDVDFIGKFYNWLILVMLLCYKMSVLFLLFVVCFWICMFMWILFLNKTQWQWLTHGISFYI